MKTTLCNKREQGLTLVELFVVLTVASFLSLVFLSSQGRGCTSNFRIRCVNNLKQTGLAFRVWAGDNGDKYPMEISETNGGTMEFTSGPNVWRHFQVMSNELSTPKVLICPSEETRMPATNFTFMNNSNISFFVNVNTSKTDPQEIWSGDRNITNGTPIKNGILELTRNHPAGWTDEMHHKVGNVLVADGSVQQMGQTGLRTAVENTSTFTNRLLMPILGP